uniref:F-box/FBD/LRR-repeat protein At1g13570-like n=1 Tax=Erigeron canadensis TaxID=72917 RepID=UPI001CB9C650|nr:F-box/FBD/LRR-repeat protein At1g13570-like [Erigeron canadensis]
MEALEGLDRISILPQNITEKILILLPIPDALKTSILSRKWRYCWASIPVLTFNDQMFEGSSSSGIQNMSQKLDTVYQVLLQHKSPLVGFTLSIELEMVSKVDQIVSYVVSRCNSTLKNVSILNRTSSPNNHYKLPCSFFSLGGLEQLELVRCDFEPPPNFTGFPSLRWLSFFNTVISAKMLKHFLTLCPRVDELFLIGLQEEDFRREDTFTFVELFELLPSIKVLALSKYYFWYFASGNMPKKLPISLVHLKILFLGVFFLDPVEVSSTLWLIKSSPNLKELMLKLHPPPIPMDNIIVNIGLQDHTGFNLDNLEELGMYSFSNLPIEMEFMKLIMANSSALKKVLVELDENVSVDQEVEMYRDLIWKPFPRASPSAELIIQRPKTSD